MFCCKLEIPDIPSARQHDNDEGDESLDDDDNGGSGIIPPIYNRSHNDDASLPPRVVSANSNAIPIYIHGPNDDYDTQTPVYIHGPDDDQRVRIANTNGNKMKPIYLHGPSDSIKAKCVGAFNNSLNK
jgi:hypothetical protein